MRQGRNETVGAKAVRSEPAGDMRRRIEMFDWAATPLGGREHWPQSLALTVDLILASGFPMAVRWGFEFTMLYNDAYVPLLGDKHPRALGRPVQEVWPEIWDELGALHRAILSGENPGFFAEDHRWVLQRYGVTEEAFFTISYSPIPHPAAPHGVGGVLITCVETTARVRGEERLRQLTTALEGEVEQRTRERERIWRVSEDLLGVSNFEGYFLSVNPAPPLFADWTSAGPITVRYLSSSSVLRCCGVGR